MYVKTNSRAMAHIGPSLIGFNWIGGRELEGDLPSFESRSSADSRDIIGIFPEAGPRDVEKAAKAAAIAFKTWKTVPAPLRGETLQRVGQVLRDQRDRLARIITREVGKTPKEAQGEVQEVIDLCTYFAGEGRRLQGETMPSELQDRVLSTHRRPLGVVGILASANFPLSSAAWKIIPAILCGNTVVWKPSEDASGIAYLFTRCMMDAGLPPGVVNVLHGKGRAGAGKHVLAGIDQGFFQAFSFFGSTPLGRLVGEACGRNLVPAHLELGGKNPMIVMEDAHLESAVQSALFAAFATAGQRSTSLGNLLLHEPIAGAFKERFYAAVGSLKVGNPLEHGEVFYGPLINPRIAHRFEHHWEEGRSGGARMVFGGYRYTEENRTEHVLGEISKGLYMAPTVWEDVAPDSWLFQNEIFGPTVNVLTFKTFDEAMALANGTPYGLTSALFTHQATWIHRFQQDIHAGMSTINGTPVGPEIQMPFGGMGWSGNGSRQGGKWSLDAFTRWHAVNEDFSGNLQLAQIETDYGALAVYEPTAWDKL